MKRVIDIPDEAYEMLKNKRVLDNIAESIIVNSTPYEERPQGEWIKEKTMKDMYRCSECGRRVDGSVLDDLLMYDEDYTISDYYPYCHCGAYMIKEAENERRN